MCVRLTSSPLFELNAGFLCEIPKHWLIHLYWSEFSPRCVASLWNIQSRALGITIIWTCAFLGASNESGCIQIKGAQSDWNHACIIMLSDKKASHLLPGSRRENWSPGSGHRGCICDWNMFFFYIYVIRKHLHICKNIQMHRWYNLVRYKALFSRDALSAACAPRPHLLSLWHAGAAALRGVTVLSLRAATKRSSRFDSGSALGDDTVARPMGGNLYDHSKMEKKLVRVAVSKDVWDMLKVLPWHLQEGAALERNFQQSGEYSAYQT